MTDLVLLGVSFLSSTLTATIGLGGGLLLLAAMPGLVPTAALIPLHGIAQLASNFSRGLFAVEAVDWRIVGSYAGGACLGALAGAPLVRRVPVDSWPLLLGVFVLLVTWTPIARHAVRLPGSWFTLGAGQTAVSLFVGAAGPLSAPALLRAGLARDRLVATHAAMMSVMHGLKVVAFALLGFSLALYLRTTAALLVGVTLGSWAGTRLRVHVPEERFRRLFRWIVTVLAVRMIVGWGV